MLATSIESYTFECISFSGRWKMWMDLVSQWTQSMINDSSRGGSRISNTANPRLPNRAERPMHHRLHYRWHYFLYCEGREESFHSSHERNAKCCLFDALTKSHLSMFLPRLLHKCLNHHTNTRQHTKRRGCGQCHWKRCAPYQPIQFSSQSHSNEFVVKIVAYVRLYCFRYPVVWADSIHAHWQLPNHTIHYLLRYLNLDLVRHTIAMEYLWWITKK